MKTAGILIVSTVLIFAGIGPTVGAPRGARHQSITPVSPAFAGLLAQYPAGGPGLSAATEAVLGESPSNANAIVQLAKMGNPDQKSAIALGVLRILHNLDPSTEAAQTIRLALPGADPEFRAILAALQIQLYAQNEPATAQGRHGNFFGSTGGGGFSGGNGFVTPLVVSPN